MVGPPAGVAAPLLVLGLEGSVQGNGPDDPHTIFAGSKVPPVSV